MFRASFLVLTLVSVLVGGARPLSNVTLHQHFRALTADNDLWAHLARNCKNVTYDCIKTSVHNYLRDTFDDPGDVQFTPFLRFTRNSFQYVPSNTTQPSYDNETYQLPLEEVSRSLTDMTKKFFLTHDAELQLPGAFFMGSVLKVSPRAMDADSTTLKVELETKQDADTSVGEGRIFFKKIREFISERLLFALLAILLVIKFLAVKLLFVLPAIIGAAAAKKLILKVLLFLFPALHHLFKLCAYTPYGAKHHIHKHQIAHIHTLGHHHHHPPVHYHHPHEHHGEIEVEEPPEGGYHYRRQEHGPHLHEGEKYPPPDDGYDEGLTSHRHDHEANEIDVWGQGHAASSTRRPTKTKSSGTRPTPSEIESMLIKAEKEAMLKARLQKEKQRLHEENLRIQEQLNREVKLQWKLKQHALKHKLPIPKHPHITKELLAPPPPGLHPPKYQPSFAEPPQITSSFAEPPQMTSSFAEPSHIASTSFVSPANVQGAFVEHSFAEPPAGYQVEEDAMEAASGHVVKVAGVNPDLQATKVAQAIKNLKQQANSQPHQRPSNPFDQSFPDHTRAVIPQHVPAQLTQIDRTDFEIDDTPPTKTKKVEAVKPSASPAEQAIYSAASITFDPFYSPILEQIDNILSELQFKDEACKERLICSMYKRPEKFSPHSNLVSAELSRDPSELQRPKSTNAAVIRFYRYLQAARDGQNRNDCLKLYPACSINTEL